MFRDICVKLQKLKEPAIQWNERSPRERLNESQGYWPQDDAFPKATSELEGSGRKKTTVGITAKEGQG